jgi:sulfonate transport system permease protein
MTLFSLDHPVSRQVSQPVLLAWLLAVFRHGGAVALGLVLPALIILAWELAVQNHLVARQILPAPALVWQTAIDLITGGNIQSELAVSAWRLAIGFGAGASLGAAIGLALGLSKTVEAYFGPTVRALWLVPSIGWLPFFILMFGIGETLKIVLIAKTCFLPVMIAVYEAVRAMPKRYSDVARVLELNRVQTLRIVVLPAILPSLLTGLRLSLSKGWQALILVEMIASAAGIGYLMTWGRKSFQLDVVMVTMVVVGVCGFALDHLAAMLQRRYGGWAERTAL